MEIEPPGTYRPQYRLRWRGFVRILDRFPRLKGCLAETVRRILQQVFAPGLVTTERVIEYPFVFQNLDGVRGPILDLGSCSSRLPIALASRGFRVIGLDFNPYPYRHPNLWAVRGDAMLIPFATGVFGAVLAISMVEHIGLGHYADPLADTGDRSAVSEIARVLRAGGRAVITVPYGKALTDHWKRVYDSARLRELLVPLRTDRVEYAVSRAGLWRPASEAEAASTDWSGPDRAVAMVVATALSS